MRSLTLVLLVLNLGYAGWWLLLRPTAPPLAAPALAPLVMPTLVLLHEATATAPVAIAQASPAPLPVEPQTTSTPAVPELLPVPEVLPVAENLPLSAPPRCYRLGPWPTVQARTAQTRWQAEHLHPWQETLRLPKRFWVVAQPAPGQAEAMLTQARNHQLKAWILTQGEWRGQVAFGNFRQSANAEQKLTAVKAVGIEATLLPETAPQTQYWLDVAQIAQPTPNNAPLVDCQIASPGSID